MKCGDLRAVLALAAVSTAQGCGWIIGLDEFVDAPPAEGTGGGGGALACSRSSECPTGINAVPACIEGTCGLACEQGFSDCDNSPGCETPTDADPKNCGGCGSSCAAYCVSSTCNDPIFIAGGYGHTCAILRDGSVFCWGFNQVGEVGDGTLTDRTYPTRIELPRPAAHIAGGGLYVGPNLYVAHTCAVLNDGAVACWGSNMQGQLGVPGLDGSLTPVLVTITDVVKVAAGGAHTCALRKNGAVLCWGASSSGQVGHGMTSVAQSPVQVASSIADIDAGGLHTCAVTSTGALRCWGSNALGQLGIGPENNQLSPTTVPGLSGVVAITAGKYHTCARAAGGVYCWGDASAGQIGLGDLIARDVPLPTSLTQAEVLALGDYHSGAITGGELTMWGENADGQLGDGTTTDALTPRAVGVSGVMALALGEKHSCALTSEGAMLCWGSNSQGALGDGTLVARSTPTPVIWP